MRFSNVFRGQRKGALGTNGLRILALDVIRFAAMDLTSVALHKNKLITSQHNKGDLPKVAEFIEGKSTVKFPKVFCKY